MLGRGGVPKCVICDADSILGVTFFYQNFSIIRCRWDLENFPLSARKHYDRACLNLNNSKKGRPTPENFTDVVQSYILYKALASGARSVAPFLGEVPLKTRHFWKITIFTQRPCLKLNYSELWRPIPVLFSGIVQNYACLLYTSDAADE